MSDVVQKLWGFCHTLRHDGIDYGDYIEQITYLLFLKMADERGIVVLKDCDWPTLRDYTGIELTDHYIDILRKLGKAPGLLGDIYAGAQSRWSSRPCTTPRSAPTSDGTPASAGWSGRSTTSRVVKSASKRSSSQFSLGWYSIPLSYMTARPSRMCAARTNRRCPWR